MRSGRTLLAKPALDPTIDLTLDRPRAERRSIPATDLLIIATASATGRTLVTLDDVQASLARIGGVAARP